MKQVICYVGTEITPSEGSTFVGGYVNIVVGLCKVLSNLGWEIHIVTTPSRFLRKAKFDFPWGKVHLVKVDGKYGSLKYGADFFIKATRRIQSLIRDESFDLIHAHSGFFSIATIPVFIKRKLGIPALLSLYCPASFLPTRLPVEKYLINRLSTNLDKVIAITYNVKKSLMKCGVKEDKIEVIPPCIDMETFNPSVLSLKEYGEVKNPRIQMVLFVGNIDRTKGLDVFVNAAEFILRRNPRVRFVITLHEPYETIQHVRVLASRRLGSHVIVMGVVKDMVSLMASADVVVAPWRSTEGNFDLPLVILEAMAMGKPVIASKVGGIMEVICNEENGVLVEPNQADELADAIIGLLNDSNLRKKISERAAQFVKQFSCIEVSQRLSDLYIKVIRSTE